MANSPTVRRKSLGTQLRRLRMEAGVSVEQAAEALDCSVGRIGHFETGRTPPRKPDLQVLLDLYRASDEVRAVLEELRQGGSKRGWWATYKLPTWLQHYVGMEADATSIRVFELELITALLQTRRYAQRVHEVSGHVVAPDAVERLVDARLRRQAILEQPDPPQLSVILSESAILRARQEGEIGIEQLEHLVTMAKMPHVSIRILPLKAGLHPAMSGSFHLLDFDPEVSIPVAYQEYAVGGHLIDDQDVVKTLSHLFDMLSSVAFEGKESLALMKRIAQRR